MGKRFVLLAFGPISIAGWCLLTTSAFSQLALTSDQIDCGGGRVESAAYSVEDSVTLVESAAGSASSSYAIVASAPDPIMAGDGDGDGRVVLAELNATVLAFRGAAACPPAADANSDGVISVEELNAVVLNYRAGVNAGE